MRFNFADKLWPQPGVEIGALEPAHTGHYPVNRPGASVMAGVARAEQQRVVCIVSPSRNVYSQTFVCAHKESLPARIKSLYGGSNQSFSDDNGPLVQPALSRRLARAVLRRSLKLQAEHFEKQALKRFLLVNKVDALLAEFGPTGTAVMDVCKETQIPLIAHFHGFDAYRRTTLESSGQRYAELFGNASAIIAVSHDMQRQLLGLGAPPEKLHYNSYGVDVSTFQGADPIHSPPTFIAVGRFVDKKAPHLTLLAFKKVVESFPDARLVMIGDGPLWEACHRMAKSLGLSTAVELLGPRSHSEVAMLMRRARAFVQHSVRTQDGDSEGTPVAVLEAGASNLPVVSTRHAGIKDAVIDGETGLLVDEGDINGMADRMLRLARDPALAAQLGSAAREWICSEFSMEKSINNLWRIIEEAIEKSNVH